MLGLVNRPDLRPAFNRPGAWLFAGDRAVLHLNDVSDRPAAPYRHAFNHVAFEAVGGKACFEALALLLDDRGDEYRSSIRDEIGLRQIFVQDPNQVRIELNFRF